MLTAGVRLLYGKPAAWVLGVVIVRRVDTVWPLEPHTAAKHDILRRYLGAWVPILGSRHQRLLYVDGFCGPGRYEGGEVGSPLVALDVADSHQPSLGQRPEFVFIDERHDRLEHLRAELAAGSRQSRYSIRVLCGRFDEVFPQVLTAIGGPAPRLPPMFVFIDPFGFAGVPYSLVTRILRYPRAEVLVRLDTDGVNRFLDHPDPGIRSHVADLFGSEEILTSRRVPGTGLRSFRQLYQTQLARCAQHVRYFEMRDRHDRVAYHLLFGTNHRLGHVKIKEAM